MFCYMKAFAGAMAFFSLNINNGGPLRIINDYLPKLLVKRYSMSTISL